MPTWYTKQQADTLLAGKATTAQVSSAIDALLAGAPGALNTLKELADAINDDANYAATVTAALNARPTAVQVAATYLTYDGTNILKNGTIVPVTGSGGSMVTYTVVDLSPGIASITGPGITDNGDGISSSIPSSAVTDNGDGISASIPESAIVPTVADLRYDLANQAGADTSDARKTQILRPFYAALALRETAPVNIMFIDDSTGEGGNATSIQTRFLSKFRDRIRHRMGQGGIAGGFGYLSAYYTIDAMQATVPQVFTIPSGATLKSRSGSQYGLGRRAIALNGPANGGNTGTADSVTVTIDPATTFKSTSVDLLYVQAATGTAGIDVYLDGTKLTSLSTNGTLADNLAYRVTIPQDATTHTVRAVATGSVAYIVGWMLYNGDESAGIRVLDASHAGSNSSYFAASSSGTNWFQRVAQFSPSLLWVSPMLNDYYSSGLQNTTPDQLATNLASIISQARTATGNTTLPVVIAPKWQRGDVGAAYVPHPWSEYVAAAYAVAAADGQTAVLDLAKRFAPGVQTGDALISASDKVHQTDAGNSYQADVFLNWLLPR